MPTSPDEAGERGDERTADQRGLAIEDRYATLKRMRPLPLPRRNSASLRSLLAASAVEVRPVCPGWSPPAGHRAAAADDPSVPGGPVPDGNHARDDDAEARRGRAGGQRAQLRARLGRRLDRRLLHRHAPVLVGHAPAREGELRRADVLARRGRPLRHARARRARPLQRALGVQHVAAQRRSWLQDPDRPVRHPLRLHGGYSFVGSLGDADVATEHSDAGRRPMPCRSAASTAASTSRSTTTSRQNFSVGAGVLGDFLFLNRPPSTSPRASRKLPPSSSGDRQRSALPEVRNERGLPARRRAPSRSAFRAVKRARDEPGRGARE